VHTIEITQPDDPRIAGFRDIRDRDLAMRDGLFVAEGKVVLTALLNARRFAVHSLLVLDRRLPGLADTLAVLDEDVPVHVAAQSVLDAIAGFHLHRGVLALVHRRADDDPARLLAAMPAQAVVPVLVGIANHDNVGAIFRNAAAFEASAVLLDGSCCDPLYRKAIRVSVGAALRVPFARCGSVEGTVHALAENGFRQFALSPSGTRSLGDVAPGGRVALYLGTEGEGLPAALMSRMETVRIPMSPNFDSLNVAAASAIALSHFYAGLASAG